MRSACEIRSVKRLLIGVFMIAIVSAASPGSAEYPDVSTPPSLEETGANDVALIVGIEDYAFLQDIDGVMQTVNDWETFFVRGLGIPSERVFVRRNKKATKEKIIEFASRAAEDADETGKLWFVFVGHGAPTKDGKDGLLVGVDAQSEPGSLEVRGVKQNKLLAELESGDQEQTVVVVDACFSGKTSGDKALAQGMQPVVPVELARVERRPSTLVLTAAGSDEFAGSLPGAERPAFSYFVLGALRGWAGDGSGTVTAGDAIYFARQQARHLDHDQTPMLLGEHLTPLVQGASEQSPELARWVKNGGPEGATEDSSQSKPESEATDEHSQPKSPSKRAEETENKGDQEQTEQEATVGKPDFNGFWQRSKNEFEQDDASLHHMRGVCGFRAELVKAKDPNTGEVHQVPECDSCPEGASNPDGSLRAHGGYIDDFSGTKRTEAILATSGCGTGHHGQNSTVALRKTERGWKMLDYIDGLDSRKCTVISTSFRSWRLCETWMVGQGYGTHIISLLWLSGDRLKSQTLIDLVDNTAVCKFDGAFYQTIEETVIEDIDGDGKIEIALAINSIHGKAIDDVSIETKCDLDRWEFSERKSLEVWELRHNRVQKDDSAARKTEHPKLKAYK